MPEYLTQEDYHEMVFEVEEKLDLCDQYIDTFQYWPHIRNAIIAQIMKKKGSETQSHTRQVPASRSGFSGTVQYITHGIKNAGLKNPFQAPNADVLVLGTSRRKHLEDGLWWDINIDPVLSDFSENYVCLEKQTVHMNESHLTPAKTDNLYYLDFPHLVGSALSKLRTDPVVSRSEQANLERVEQQLESELELKLDMVSLVEQSYKDHQKLSPVYRRIIKTVDPEIVLTNKPIFTNCCKKLGIPVVNYQAYPIQSKNEKFHYPGTSRITTIGDYLLIWGDYWRHTVDYPIPDDRLITVGYPYSELRRDKYSNNEIKNQITFISQPTIGHELSKFAVKLARMNPECNVIYKPHPRVTATWREAYPWLETADVKVAGSRSGELYQLLSESKAIVGFSSSVFTEAIAFNTKIFQISLKRTNIPNVRHLHQEDLITVVDTPEELLSELEQNTTSNAFDDSHFLARDATETFRDTLHRLIDHATPVN